MTPSKLIGGLTNRSSWVIIPTFTQQTPFYGASSKMLTYIGFGIVAALLLILAELKSLSKVFGNFTELQQKRLNSRNDNDLVSRIALSAETLANSSHEIRYILEKYCIPPVSKDDPETSSIPAWQIENDKRREIKSISENLTGLEFGNFIANRYRLPVDDAWVSHVMKVRTAIGLEAAITEIRKRDNATGNSLGSLQA